DSAGANCAAIELATTSTYTLSEADVDKTVRVAVTATNEAGPSTPASSAPTAAVTAPPPPPINTTSPTISGTAQPAQTLSASTGACTGSPTCPAHRSSGRDSAGANCAAIELATTSTYTLSEADVDKTVRVAVTASNA